VGVVALALLLWIRLDLQELAQSRFGVPTGVANAHRARRPGALWCFLTMAWSMRYADLGAKGVALVGDVPQGLPMLSLPGFNLDT
jgi:SulP family sulfate permease